MIKKETHITVVDQAFIECVTFAQLITGRKLPDFTGKVVAVAPTLEEYASLDENFASAVEHGMTQDDLKDQIIYYDKGAERHFILGYQDVQEVQ